MVGRDSLARFPHSVFLYQMATEPGIDVAIDLGLEGELHVERLASVHVHDDGTCWVLIGGSGGIATFEHHLVVSVNFRFHAVAFQVEREVEEVQAISVSDEGSVERIEAISGVENDVVEDGLFSETDCSR